MDIMPPKKAKNGQDTRADANASPSSLTSSEAMDTTKDQQVLEAIKALKQELLDKIEGS